MRERIEELAQGKFEYFTPQIELSDVSMEFETDIDGRYEGEFSIKTLNMIPIKGFLYTSTNRMKCNNTEFIGEEIKFRYTFEAAGLLEGEVFKGNIYIISNGGEFNIPFFASIQKNNIESSLGHIRNLFHFTNLALDNWEEAYKLFVSDRFEDILINNDKKYLMLYKALTSKNANVTEKTMEEFLVGINKKSEIRFLVDDSIREYSLDESIKEEFEIKKNTWGYSKLNIKTDCDFISFEKNIIYTREFIGNSYKMEYFISHNKLHAGNNYGKIIIYNKTQHFEIPVIVHEKKDAPSEKALVKADIYRLVRRYIDYRCKRINTNPWVKESMELLNNICQAKGTQTEYELMKAQLLLMEKKNYEAKEIIENYEKNRKKRSNDLNDIYAMYLTTFYNRDKKYIDKVAAGIEKMYEKNKENWQHLWILMFMDEKLNIDESKKYRMLKEQFKMGCTSPVIYVEAFKIFKNNSISFHELDIFEIQILWWAVKEKVIDGELAVFIANLSRKGKQFNHILYKILVNLYNEYPQDEILSAICSILIKGNKVEEKYFEWYAKGIERDVRITRLYEYYMYSIPLNKKIMIPKAILMYFAYNNNLDYRKKAYIFENVILQRDVMPELFQSYRRHIEEFISEQISQKHNDKRLAFIYETMLSANDMTKDMAADMPNIIFKAYAKVKSNAYKNIIVYDKYINKEEKYPIYNNEAYINIYSESCETVLEDEHGNRYFSKNKLSIDNLMDVDYYVKKCFELHKDNLYINLRICRSAFNYGEIDKEHANVLDNLIHDNNIQDYYKAELIQVLTKYYFDNDDDEAFETHIRSIDMGILSPLWKKKIIEYFIVKGMYDTAYKNISRFGYEGIEINKLLRLVTYHVLENGYQYDELIYYMAVYIFNNKKYSEVTLRYIILFYHGSSKQMKNIWKASKRFEIESYELAERLIVQMLFTNTFIGETGELFKYYHMGCKREKIANAYMTYNAYEYVIQKMPIEDEVKGCIKREYLNEKEINPLCELALLKSYAEVKSLSDYDKEIVKELLWKYIKQGIYFNFYEKLSSDILEQAGIEDKNIIEYITKPKTRVFIHYVHENKDGIIQDYGIEEIKSDFEGVYTKIFTMFYGDSIQYYICENDEYTGLLTKSDTIFKNDADIDGAENRYNLLNTMNLCRIMDDDITLMEIMENYAKVSDSIDRLFVIM